MVNELGSDKANFYFNILDVPGPPTGPITYDDITGSSVTISWKKPKDDGGSPITGYAIEKKDLDHLGGWVPAVNFVEPYIFTATVLRLLEGTQYEFRVFAINAQGRSIPLPTGKKNMPFICSTGACPPNSKIGLLWPDFAFYGPKFNFFLNFPLCPIYYFAIYL